MSSDVVIPWRGQFYGGMIFMSYVFRARCISAVLLGLASGPLDASECPPGLACSQPMFFEENGHFYNWVDVLSLPEERRGWSFARAASASLSFEGLDGYLATITSQAEQNFVASQFGGNGRLWIGGTDQIVEGEWRWDAGPEAGELFWRGDRTGIARGFAYWHPSEPNNVPHEPAGEDFLMFNWISNGQWNDLPSVQQNYLINGYIVEYSPSVVPEPSSYILAGIGMIGVAGARRLRRRRAYCG